MATDAASGPGARLRRARVSRELSQSDLARRLGVSASYLSLIEAGRRPPPEGLLAAAARELGLAHDALSTGGTSDPAAEVAALELELRFAEMVFRSGDPGAALQRFDAALETATTLSRADLASTARWGRGRCREGVGDADGALADYEELWSSPELPVDLDRAWLGVALCRVYRDYGDLSRAVDVGEAVLASLDQVDEQVSLENRTSLTVTLASAYAERGDLARAQHLIATALAEAERADSPRARGSAYWQAAIVSQERGQVSDARRYVDRAIALFGEGDNQQALGALRITSGWIHLRGPQPDPDTASVELRRALDAETVRADTLLASQAETELARALLMRDEPAQALSLVRSALGRMSGGDLVQQATSHLVAGQAHLALGDDHESLAAFRLAAEQLDRCGALRQAAAAWRELAESLTTLGRPEEAVVAYRRAADAAGVLAPSRAPARTRTH